MPPSDAVRRLSEELARDPASLAFLPLARLLAEGGRVDDALRIARLGAAWSTQWQRPPTAKELKGLVDAYVREEVLYREALALGLDRDDTIIRRRLAQKLEFLTEDLGIPGDREVFLVDLQRN